jgi:hypothetical protein
MDALRSALETQEPAAEAPDATAEEAAEGTN